VARQQHEWQGRTRSGRRRIVTVMMELLRAMDRRDARQVAVAQRAAEVVQGRPREMATRASTPHTHPLTGQAARLVQ
jgi:hypothetical protein